MKACLQRVSSASVCVGGERIAEIGAGLLLLLCVEQGDDEDACAVLARKVCELRVFEDARGRMNLSVKDAGGELLVISQFTLAADCRRGRRPSFDRAAAPDDAVRLYELFCDACSAQGLAVKRGRFAAHMQVALTNDGPVTIMLDSRELTGSK